MTVTRLVTGGYGFKNYMRLKADQIDMWLLTMEKSCQPYFLPGDMFKTLQKTSRQSIEKDFNMIIEEYGFWDLCRVTDQSLIIRELFAEQRLKLDPLLDGCEENFINNFIISFSYRTYLAGEVMQYGDRESFEICIVWKGQVAVEEMTEFGEPVLVYT